MPSETDELLQSLRRWLKAAVFLIGVGIVTLSDIGYTVANYESGTLYATTGAIGAILALTAFLSVLNGVGNPNPTDATNPENEAK